MTRINTNIQFHCLGFLIMFCKCHRKLAHVSPHKKQSQGQRADVFYKMTEMMDDGGSICLIFSCACSENLSMFFWLASVTYNGQSNSRCVGSLTSHCKQRADTVCIIQLVWLAFKVAFGVILCVQSESTKLQFEVLQFPPVVTLD